MLNSEDNSLDCSVTVNSSEVFFAIAFNLAFSNFPSFISMVSLCLEAFNSEEINGDARGELVNIIASNASKVRHDFASVA